MQHGLQLASQAKADFAVVIGEEELKTQTVKLKNMATREQIDLPLHGLIAALKKLETTHV